MKFILIFFAFISFFLLNGCSQKENHLKENGKQLQSLINSALQGDEKANLKLGNLTDISLPVKNNYTKIAVDSFYEANKKFYYTVIENPHPAYNRFAVYDNDLYLILLDKSLNGEITTAQSTISDMKFIRLIESFISKDLYNAKRLSLYKIDSSNVKLVFRDFVSLLEPNMFLSQELRSISKDTLITSLSFPERIEITEKVDTFIFNGNKFESEKKIFESLVKNKISNDKNPAFLKQIVDERSLKESVN